MTRRALRPRILVPLVAGAVAASLPGTAAAHGIGETYTLPIPLQYYLFGAGLAVSASFLLSALFLDRHPALSWNHTIRIPWLGVALGVLRVALVAVVLLAIATGWYGTANPVQNLSPLFLWVFLLVGFSVLSLLVGNLWAHVNPWRLLSLVDRLPPDREHMAGPMRISPVVGVTLLFGLFWWELVSVLSFRPDVIAEVLLVYTLLNIVAGRLFENWFEDGEVFSVLFGFVGRLAVLRIGDDRRSLSVSPPRLGFDGERASWATLGIASVLLAGATFDSVKETTMWFDWQRALGTAETDQRIVGTVGLAATPLVVIGTYLTAVVTLACSWGSPAAGGITRGSSSGRSFRSPSRTPWRTTWASAS